MAAKLVIEEGDLKGLSLSLEEGEEWIIGRDPDESQLVIEDPLVSRRHLHVRRSTEGIIIENLSTTNPVLVNDEPIGEQSRLLQNGDSLKVGNELLRYYEDISAHVLEEEPSIIEEEEFEMAPPSIPEIKKEESAEAPKEELSDRNTLFEEEGEEAGKLAEVDFGYIETGRWLLKVIGGPNNGAEFYMESGKTYILGTDPKNADIVFNDTSVSRQHAKITVTAEDTLSIEDLKSRNGVLVNGVQIETRQPLTPNTIVNLGTTSFVIYDREGEMQTIISPLLPSIVKVLQQEQPKKEEVRPEVEPEPAAVAATHEKTEEVEAPPPKAERPFGFYLLLTGIIGLLILAGIGTSSLFREEPVIVQHQENAEELLQQVFMNYPALHYSFNKTSGGLLVLGHVSTVTEKNQLIHQLDNLKFIKSRDVSDVVIDDLVWQEVNSILSKTPAWRGISIHSPAAGEFVLTGYLQTRKQAEQLSSYVSLIFPYLDLLKKEIVVEEDVVNQIQGWLNEKLLDDVDATMNNGGEVTLSGTVPPDKSSELSGVIGQIKQIPGVRVVNNLVKAQATAETGIINISDMYRVTGESRVGNKYTVVINGRILSENDDIDGMLIKKITPDRILLEKNGEKYRIDY